MAYTKTIACFANSRKINGRCIAGREWDGQRFGPWIRPISAAAKGEVGHERFYGGGGDPNLVDIIEMLLVEHCPHGCQTENHLIDPSQRWVKRGSLNWNQLSSAVEEVSGPLWVNGNSTYNGLNDRIEEGIAATLPNSLVLVRAENVTLIVGTEGAVFGNPHRRVRGHFSLAGEKYVLAVTDPRH